MTRGSWAFHDDDLPLMQPSYGDIAGLEILGYNDMRLPRSGRDPGWDQTYEFRVVENRKGRFAYCGNGSRGWSVVDATNPRAMRVVHRQPHSFTPDNTQYIDIKGDDILVVKRNTRLEMWDVKNPSSPRFLSSYTPDDIATDVNAPYHGLWIHEDDRGRRYAFAACDLTGVTVEILICVDITDPRNPFERARWWYPGMAVGEENLRNWGADITVRCHDMTAYGDRCYVAWRDKGLIILDISDIHNTTRSDKLPLVGEINWADGLPRRRLDGVDVAFPALPGQTHSFGIVIPKDGGPVETVVGTDELGQCPFGFLHFIDVRNESRPTEISQFRVPLNFHGNCPADRFGNRMGIHDVERMIRGNIVWGAWEEGGFWGIDFSDIHYPRHVAYYVPPVRSDSTRRSGHADDVFVTDDGIIFGSSSDAGAGGLWALAPKPGFKGKVTWNADESNVIVTGAP
jgi:hypothetical protein